MNREGKERVARLCAALATLCALVAGVLPAIVVQAWLGVFAAYVAADVLIGVSFRWKLTTREWQMQYVSAFAFVALSASVVFTHGVVRTVFGLAVFAMAAELLALALWSRRETS